MKNLYYLIWSDAIQSIRKLKSEKENWKYSIFTFVTWMHALNIWIIMVWMKYFKVFTLPLIHIDIFPGILLDSSIAFIIEFALPVGLVNYFLIFYKKRYEHIVIKYKINKIKYGYIYSLTMIFGAYVSAMLVFGKLK